jgi:hypothetical protein
LEISNAVSFVFKAFLRFSLRFLFSLLKDIRKFASSLESWLTSSLENLPAKLIQRKLPVAKRFGQALKRQTAFIHIAQVRITATNLGILNTQGLWSLQHQDYIPFPLKLTTMPTAPRWEYVRLKAQPDRYLCPLPPPPQL